MIDTHGRKYVQPIFDHISTVLIRLHLTPIAITIIALILGLSAAISIGFGFKLAAILLLWLSGLFDVLDGTVARKTGTSSNLGAFIDITFDRIVELSMIIAMTLYNPNLSFMSLILTATIVMSMTIFLTVGSFAKNTGQKSFYYQAGVTERTEAFIFFTLMILLPQFTLVIGYIFAITILFTAGQRFREGILILGKH